MVEKEHLPNAIALNATLFNAARVIGPAVAGVLIASFGEGICFLLNSASYIGVLVALYFIVPLSNEKEGPSAEGSVIKKFLGGFEYIRQSREIFPLLLLSSVLGAASVFPMILMPVFIRDIYHLGSRGLGIFLSASGAGALAGALLVASKKGRGNARQAILSAALLLALSLVSFGLTRNIYAAMLFIAIYGFALVSQAARTNIVIQLATPFKYRGRVMGFYVTAFIGSAPIGNMLAGYLAHQFSAPLAVVLSGGIYLFVILVLWNKIIK